jgi:serralysin
MPLNAQEQYLLELINRGRLNPAAEAARYGVDLNAGLGAGTISTAAKQVLAPNELLENAAIGHAKWMLAANTFSHTGAGGSTLGTRATSAGYAWTTVGENIAVWGVSGVLNATAAIDAHHKGLVQSAGHRINLLHNGFSEVGLAQESGKFTFANGASLNASMLTELFGHQGGGKYLTGVAYTDTNKNGFYSVGEGKALTQFKVAGLSDTTEAAGGYALSVAAVGEALVSGRSGSISFSLTVDFAAGNVKLDIVNGTTFHTSGNVKLGTGIANVDLLGIADLTAAGTAANNIITGNDGANLLSGQAGNDVIDGRGGNDNLAGGLGNDRLMGNAGNDRLMGDAGADYLAGGAGQDHLQGGLGADQFVFANFGGADVVEDFSKAQADRLYINDDLWSGRLTQTQMVQKYARVTSDGVVFNFGDGDTLTLSGVTSTQGLAASILFW